MAFPRRSRKELPAPRHLASSESVFSLIAICGEMRETGLAATQRFAMLLPAGLPPSAVKAAC
jgi:hypothetical protein